MYVSRCVGLLLGVLLSVGLMGQAGAAEDWLVRTTGGKTQHLLFKDGSITKVEPQKGDPKTDYSKSENRCHSTKQRAKSAECSAEEDEAALDITGWTLIGQGGGPHTAYKAEFKNPDSTDQLREVIIVTYNLTTGEVLKVVMERNTDSTEQTELPDLTGLTLDSYHSSEDGTSRGDYFNDDWTASTTINYDADGSVARVRTWTRETVEADNVKLPTFCTGTYGCIG